MTDEIFTTWGDLENDKVSVWHADWYLDQDQQKETVFLTMTYDERHTFEWFYPEILETYESNNVKGLLEKYLPEETVSEEDLKELYDFFSQWLNIIDMGGSIEFDVDDNNIIDISED